MKYKVREMGGAYTTAALEPMIQSGEWLFKRTRGRRARCNPPKLTLASPAMFVAVRRNTPLDAVAGWFRHCGYR